MLDGGYHWGWYFILHCKKSVIIFKDQNATILINMMRYTLPERICFPSDEWINNNVRHNFLNKQKMEHTDIYISKAKNIW